MLGLESTFPNKAHQYVSVLTKQNTLRNMSPCEVYCYRCMRRILYTLKLLLILDYHTIYNNTIIPYYIRTEYKNFWLQELQINVHYSVTRHVQFYTCVWVYSHTGDTYYVIHVFTFLWWISCLLHTVFSAYTGKVPQYYLCSIHGVRPSRIRCECYSH